MRELGCIGPFVDRGVGKKGGVVLAHHHVHAEGQGTRLGIEHQVHLARCLREGASQARNHRVAHAQRHQQGGKDVAFLVDHAADVAFGMRSEEHTSELQSLMRSSYAVFCLKKKKKKTITTADVNTKLLTTTRHNILPNNTRRHNIKTTTQNTTKLTINIITESADIATATQIPLHLNQQHRRPNRHIT